VGPDPLSGLRGYELSHHPYPLIFRGYPWIAYIDIHRLLACVHVATEFSQSTAGQGLTSPRDQDADIPLLKLLQNSFYYRNLELFKNKHTLALKYVFRQEFPELL